jgi:hypothetical protein
MKEKKKCFSEVDYTFKILEHDGGKHANILNVN